MIIMDKPLRRKIDAYLAKWRNNPDRKPLIVKGARQVGKTFSIEEFASKTYSSIIKINFVEQPNINQYSVMAMMSKVFLKIFPC